VTLPWHAAEEFTHAEGDLCLFIGGGVRRGTPSLRHEGFDVWERDTRRQRGRAGGRPTGRGGSRRQAWEHTARGKA
jgi:hypothetical protein